MPEHGRRKNQPQAQPVRLQKFLASAGIGSRRHCEEFILAGRVSVDGETVCELGTRIDPDRQKVMLDGEPVKVEPKRYYLLNKPPGFVCTNRDPQGRPRAIDLVPQQNLRLFTVGRLDANSCGLLLVTNDGELSNRMAHPRFGVERRYQVQVVGRPDRDTLDKMKRGLYFAGGKFRIKRIRKLKTKGNSTFLELVLTEGQNREIRRLLARVGHKVIHLQRVGFGPFHLGRLGEGKYRPLKPGELKALRDLLNEPTARKTASRTQNKHHPKGNKRTGRKRSRRK